MATVQVPSLRQYPALHTDRADLVILMMNNDQHKLTLSSTIKKSTFFNITRLPYQSGRPSISAGSTQKQHHEQSPTRTIIINKGSTFSKMTPSVHVQGSGQVVSSRQTETKLKLTTTKNVFPCRTICLFSILTLHFQVSQWKVDSSTFLTTLDFATLKSTEKEKTNDRTLQKTEIAP